MYGSCQTNMCTGGCIEGEGGGCNEGAGEWEILLLYRDLCLILS